MWRSFSCSNVRGRRQVRANDSATKDKKNEDPRTRGPRTRGVGSKFGDFETRVLEFIFQCRVNLRVRILFLTIRAAITGTIFLHWEPFVDSSVV